MGVNVPNLFEAKEHWLYQGSFLPEQLQNNVELLEGRLERDALLKLPHDLLRYLLVAHADRFLFRVLYLLHQSLELRVLLALSDYVVDVNHVAVVSVVRVECNLGDLEFVLVKVALFH